MSRDIKFDYTELRKKYAEVFGSQEAYAKAIGMDRTSLIKRLNNEIPFRADEIVISQSVLNLSPEDIKIYFFTPKVEKTELMQEVV